MDPLKGTDRKAIPLATNESRHIQSTTTLTQNGTYNTNNNDTHINKAIVEPNNDPLSKPFVKQSAPQTTKQMSENPSLHISIEDDSALIELQGSEQEQLNDAPRIICPSLEDVFTIPTDAQLTKLLEQSGLNSNELSLFAKTHGKSLKSTIERAQFLKEVRSAELQELVKIALKWPLYARFYILSANRNRELFIEPINETVRHGNEFIFEIREIPAFDNAPLLFGMPVPDKKYSKKMFEKSKVVPSFMIPPNLKINAEPAKKNKVDSRYAGKTTRKKVILDETLRLERSHKKFKIHHLFDSAKDYRFPHLFRPGTRVWPQPQRKPSVQLETEVKVDDDGPNSVKMEIE